jgi:hypothetical protein
MQTLWGLAPIANMMGAISLIFSHFVAMVASKYSAKNTAQQLDTGAQKHLMATFKWSSARFAPYPFGCKPMLIPTSHLPNTNALPAIQKTMPKSTKRKNAASSSAKKN